MQNWIDNKIEYRKFCQTHGTLPVFLQDWWLDTVGDRGAWDVCLSKDKGGNILGVLPFYYTKQFGFKIIKMPDLTPYLGVWLKYPVRKVKAEARHRFQKKVMTDLIEQLPGFAYYAQRHPPQLENGLPFLWKGFRQTTRFSYRLPPSGSIEETFAKLKGSVRTELRKAEGEVTVFESEDIRLFYALQKKSFDKQAKAVPYTFAFLEKIDEVLKEKKQRKILVSTDKKGNIHAAIYLLWDEQTVYNLLQGADPEFGDSGGIKRLLWEGVKFAREQQRVFDFEGGMMPNIEPVFSAFGGKLQPYFKMYKGGNLLFRCLSAIRNG